ncbi:GntR family transcriptional regulator [Paenibacillus sp. LHD-38]|uniref:GntR family transcriptional regulator n=1 Tax=Paenibacillus sp. LHD-38 TaxID=3072143 RepID=UPI00281018AB|nr:GntR family transcriptional regulator [Paenibacillus sp. LHD-38]MDQ8734496.1 GntR family transcriptional regulator [Paenibacillus sp. LHD-38]
MSQDARPLYSRIYKELKNKIESGDYKVDQQIPTEIELAEMHGVSRITSKRALIELEREGLIYRKRGSGSFVKKLDNRSLSSISEGKIISMILPYVAANGLLGYIHGATDYLDDKGYYLAIHSSNWSKDKEKELIYSLPRRGVSGILLYPVSTLKNLDAVYSLYMNRHPIVTIDQYYDNVPVGSVTSDNFNGGYTAASKLIELGHRNIAFVSSINLQYRSSVRDRFYGYCKALQDAAISVDGDIIVDDFIDKYESSEKPEFVQSLIDRLLEKGVTAIQAEHDHLAVDLVRAAVERNVMVPEDLSIVGFDNHEISANIEIPVTTINQNFYEIGKQAAAMLVDQIEQGIVRQQNKVEIEVEWVGRQSTGLAN